MNKTFALWYDKQILFNWYDSNDLVLSKFTKKENGIYFLSMLEMTSSLTKVGRKKQLRPIETSYNI